MNTACIYYVFSEEYKNGYKAAFSPNRVGIDGAYPGAYPRVFLSRRWIQVDTSDTRRIRIGYVYPVYPTDTQKYCQIHAEYIHAEYMQDTDRIHMDTIVFDNKNPHIR